MSAQDDPHAALADRTRDVESIAEEGHAGQPLRFMRSANGAKPRSDSKTICRWMASVMPAPRASDVTTGPASSAIDLAHAPGTDGGQDFPGTEARAGGEGQLSGIIWKRREEPHYSLKTPHWLPRRRLAREHGRLRRRQVSRTAFCVRTVSDTPCNPGQTP